MKKSCFIFALLVSTLAGAQAQVAGTGATTTTNQPALPVPKAFSPVSRDASSTVWERTVYSRGPNGTVVPRKSRYTELSSGLNYRDPNTGQWTPSREQIDLLPAGGAFAAAATHGQHSARYPLDIARGVILLSGPDGKQLTSRPVGLFFEDDSNSALIAILTNSVGELVGSNEVVYPDAFEGASASLHYKYTLSGFEQDVVLEGQLPDPAAMGLNPARTRLGVLTAFFDTNNPVATAGPTDPADGLSDTTLTFGAMKMGRGQAFSIGNTEPFRPPHNMTPAAWLNWMTNAARQSSSKGTSTYKRWFQLNGHNFLMEEVPYQRVAAQLQQLPPTTGRLGIIATNLFAANSILNGISAEPAQISKTDSGKQKAESKMQKSEMRRLAKTGWDQTRALVLDYSLTLNPGNYSSYTFQGDTTYLISGYCDFGNVTFEGGTVIKYPNVNSLNPRQIGAWNYGTAYIEVDGTLTCKTSSYRPAVFTAVDDNTVGEPIGNGYTEGNFYANPAIYAPGGVSLTNVRISYAEQAVWVSNGSSITLSDSQVTDSGTMAVLGLGYGYSGYGNPMTLTCNNCLYKGPYEYVRDGVVVVDSGNGGDSYHLNNCTIDGVYYMVAGPSYNNNGYAVNCIFADTEDQGSSQWQGSYNGFYGSCDDCYYTSFGGGVFTAWAYPFQTAGGGNYYLATNPDGSDASGFRGQGTTYGVSSSLLADLAAKTTQPPDNTSYVGQTISSPTTLSPGGLANTGTPDLGYHYPILDYIVSQTVVGANHKLTVGPGAAVGWQGQGLSFSGVNTMEFDGTASQPCYFVRCSTVQEADNSGNSSGDGTGIAGSSQSLGIAATFTRFSALGNQAVFFDANSIYTYWVNYDGDPMSNCEFWSGAIGGNADSKLDLECCNCLFDRTMVNASISTNNDSFTLALQNCTLHGGNLTLDNPSDLGPFQVSVSDCAFDGTTLAINDPNAASDFSCYYNAYISGANYLPSPNENQNNDVFVTGSFNWQGGPLGNYYLPVNSPLIDNGEYEAYQINVIVNGTTGATEPLSDFTTQTSQTLDSGLVDIGYHYVASAFIPTAPQLTTACLSDGIALNWTLTSGLPITDFKIYRRLNPGGSYDVSSPLATVSSDSRFYVDKTVSANQNYCYLVTFDYYDPFTDTTYPTSPAAPNAPGYSNESCNRKGCSPPTLPPSDSNGMDVVFIFDNTSSIGYQPLQQLIDNITPVLNDIQTASGNNYRLALVTPDNDQVDVRVPFSNNNRTDFINAFTLSKLSKAGDGTTSVTGNSGIPESTDECLNTVVNGLFAANRTNPRGCTPLDSPLQYNDFSPGFTNNALKLVVMITDAEPGGFCNVEDNGYQSVIYAQAARTNCIHINAILVNDTATTATATAVIQNYYQTSCGWYEQIPADGTGIADAVRYMLYAPGYCNCQ